MDINKTLQELKARPGFTEHVGMMLVHNGVVRGWSRKDHAPVSAVRVSHDNAKMREICREMEQRPGIFAIVAQAEEGLLKPGDGLLWSGSFLALRQADGTVRRLFGPCAVRLADDPHRATALFVPRM